MTSTEYLTHMGRISGVSKINLKTRIRELHEFFSLEQTNTLKMTHFSYDPEVRKGYIDDLFTLPEYRNRGIGHVLLSRAEQYLSKTGSNAVQLHVADTNLAALLLYQQANFKRIKEKIEMRMPF